VDGRAARAAVFSVLIAPPNGPIVLSPDAEFFSELEKEAGLAERLAGSGPFTAGRRQIFVTGSTAYPGGRVLYSCVAVPGNAPSSDLSKS
jgi:hypothetical protein